MGIPVNTSALFYRKICIVIAEKPEAEAFEFTGEIERDERYFGGVRKGKYYITILHSPSTGMTIFAGNDGKR